MTQGQKADGEASSGGAHPEDPTAVERPVAGDETSPEGINTDDEATGIEQSAVEDAAQSDERPIVPKETTDPDPPSQVRLLHAPPTQWRWRIARIVAALALAGTAFGVHMWLNVPDHPVVVAPRDQDKKKPPQANRGNREPTPPRSEAELEEAWSQWSGVPFEEEPMRGRWSRDMQNMVNKAVVVARKAAFAGAPEEPRVIVTGTQCRTIRCRFVLRSPFEHELDVIAKSLERVTYDGEPMWRHLETERIDPPTPQSPKDDHYRQVIVGVRADVYEPDGLEIPADPAEDKEKEKE